MITLLIVLMAICVAAIILLAIGGLLAVCWPIAVVLIIGMIIDLLVLKKIFKS